MKAMLERWPRAFAKSREKLGKAGLSIIPRPFDNIRMTRSNEIYDRFGPFKESQWIGHSDKVRDDHYLMIQDDDYTETAGMEKSLQKWPEIDRNTATTGNTHQQ